MQTDEGLSELQKILHPTDDYEEKETLATEQITEAKETPETPEETPDSPAT